MSTKRHREFLTDPQDEYNRLVSQVVRNIQARGPYQGQTAFANAEVVHLFIKHECFWHIYPGAEMNLINNPRVAETITAEYFQRHKDRLQLQSATNTMPWMPKLYCCSHRLHLKAKASKLGTVCSRALLSYLKLYRIQTWRVNVDEYWNCVAELL